MDQSEMVHLSTYKAQQKALNNPITFWKDVKKKIKDFFILPTENIIDNHWINKPSYKGQTIYVSGFGRILSTWNYLLLNKQFPEDNETIRSICTEDNCSNPNHYRFCKGGSDKSQ